MGLENRDYYRDGSYTASIAGWGLDFTPAVKYLIIANVVVFLLQIFITRTTPAEMPEGFEAEIARQEAAIDKAEAEARKARTSDEKTDKETIDRQKQAEALRKARRAMERMLSQPPGMRVSIVQEWFELDPEKTILQGQVWRLLTCAFCHHRFAVWHILFNMVLLYWFGTRLERMYGSREFLLFYLAAALCGSLAYVGLAFYTGSYVAAIGASGAIMGVMVLYTIFHPFETFLICWLIPVPLWVLLGLYVLYDVHPVLLALAGDQFFSGVAHAGHLGGLAFGFVYWKLGLRLEAPFERGERRRRPTRRKPEPPREPVILEYPRRDEFDDRLDEVLRKISEQGQASLTDEERSVLIKASEKYRGKK